MQSIVERKALVQVDLPEIFAKKNPRLAPYIPRFVYFYLNRALHIQEINEILDKHGDKLNYEFITATIKDFNVTTDFRSTENLPENGRVIFAANHPLGGFDGMLMLKMLIEKYGSAQSISNDILLNLKNIQGLFLPINKHGNQSFDVVENFDKVMKSDTTILTFPAGLVSRRQGGVIRDVPWKKNFIAKSIQYRRDVIPVHISGRCTDFFYNIARIRKFLGIRSNLEMFYLPDETFRHKNKHFTITIGPRFSWTHFDKSKKPVEWALDVQDFVYSMVK